MIPEHRPPLPRRRDWRIGCVGSGFVMRDCHLPAYAAAGFRPVAIASRNPDTATAVAAQHAIQVLDVAVPPQAQPEVIRRACEAGRGRLLGILAQKPLAMTVREGRELVECCERAGVVLAVNQNMRFDQSIRAAKGLLDRDDLGEIILATIDMRAVPHWMPWARGLPSLSTFVMSIHHLDTFRYWLGTPDRVLASTRPDPRTTFHHVDGINLVILEYDRGPRAGCWDDVWAGPHRDADGIHWRIEGTLGLARGTIGWPKYPARTPSTLEYRTTGDWHRSDWPQAWFPDAFAGTLAQLLIALENKAEPEISGRDNLATLALCEAVYAAATQHRVTTVAEFLSP
jgi:predicted dehydrogenase